MKKQIVTSLTLGSLVTVTAFTAMVSANENPFAASKLDSGYQLAQADTKTKEGKCGGGKCGGDKETGKQAEGKCGEGKCGGDKKAGKQTEGKCGEGKCGGDK